MTYDSIIIVAYGLSMFVLGYLYYSKINKNNKEIIVKLNITKEEIEEIKQEIIEEMKNFRTEL